MRVDIVTLFPEIIEPYFSSGLLKAAIENELIEIHFHYLREFTRDKHRQVDDRPFGGGPGMVLKPEPFFRAVEHVQSLQSARPRVLIMTARGKLFNQKQAVALSNEHSLLILCGRYQEIDERVYSLADDEISIGNFILSGGEIAALAVTEAVCRLVPGVLGNEESFNLDSFSNERLLGPPQYTRPPEYRGMEVPDVLFTGNHAEIERWRTSKSLEKTRQNRPDLLEEM